MIVLVTGGAVSGKSAFAERYAESLGLSGIYVETAQLLDDQTKDRIERQRCRRDERSFPWKTLEEPLRLSERVEALDFEYNVYRGAHAVVVVDDLTVWISNVLLQWEHDENAEALCMARVDALIAALRRFQGTILLVTNEVGLRPASPAAPERLFIEMSERMNRLAAAVSDQVVLVTAGIPVELKCREMKW